MNKIKSVSATVSAHFDQNCHRKLTQLPFVEKIIYISLIDFRGKSSKISLFLTKLPLKRTAYRSAKS